MVFGVFDGLHLGHLHFLQQAAALGRELTVVVAQDALVRKMKGKAPKWMLRRRTSAVRKVGCVTKVIAGDKKLNSWIAVKKIKPNIVALGYDQKRLGRALRACQDRFGFRLVTLKPFKPRLYHSSRMS